LSLFWQFGSIIAVLFGIQLVVGLIVSSSFVGSSEAFEFLWFCVRDNSYGYAVKAAHANVCAIILAALYCHLQRSVSTGSPARSLSAV
jgi:quinol-cytochrome oxidoreductase complex cytochrome b subunit